MQQAIWEALPFASVSAHGTGSYFPAEISIHLAPKETWEVEGYLYLPYATEAALSTSLKPLNFPTLGENRIHVERLISFLNYQALITN